MKLLLKKHLSKFDYISGKPCRDITYMEISICLAQQTFPNYGKTLVNNHIQNDILYDVGYGLGKIIEKELINDINT